MDRGIKYQYGGGLTKMPGIRRQKEVVLMVLSEAIKLADRLSTSDFDGEGLSDYYKEEARVLKGIRAKVSKNRDLSSKESSILDDLLADSVLKEDS